MKIYSYYGFNEFIIFPGYKGYMIKEYFANYYLHIPNVTRDRGFKTDIKKNMNENPREFLQTLENFPDRYR